MAGADQETELGGIPGKLTNELKQVRRFGFSSIRAEKYPVLASLCPPPALGQTPDVPIRRRLLDCLDPEQEDEHGRPIRRDLAEREPQDRGMLGRILFAEAEDFTLKTCTPPRLIRARGVGVEMRYDELSRITGLPLYKVKREGGLSAQILLDLKHRLLEEAEADGLLKKKRRAKLLPDGADVPKTPNASAAPSGTAYSAHPGPANPVAPSVTAVDSHASWYRRLPALTKHRLRMAGLAALTLIVLAVVAALGIASGGGSTELTSANINHRARTPMSQLGWWPDRLVYPCSSVEQNVCQEARVPSLDENSWLPRQFYGVQDERSFLNAMPASQVPEITPSDPRSLWPKDPVDVKPGEFVRVEAVVDNAADSEFAIRPAAVGVTAAMFLLPGCRKNQTILGDVAQSDPHYQVVSDTLSLIASEPVCLSVVLNSARWTNQDGTFPISSQNLLPIRYSSFPDRRLLVPTGWILGCKPTGHVTVDGEFSDQFDGTLPGKRACDGFVSVLIGISAPHTKLSAPPATS